MVLSVFATELCASTVGCKMEASRAAIGCVIQLVPLASNRPSKRGVWVLTSTHSNGVLVNVVQTLCIINNMIVHESELRCTIHGAFGVVLGRCSGVVVVVTTDRPISFLELYCSKLVIY